MPIAARSAPNNGRVKEAKVSSCTQGTGKALNGKAKRSTNRQTNGDEKGEVRQVKRGNRYKLKRWNRYKLKRGDKRKNSDDDIKESRGADKSGNVRGNVRGNGEGERGGIGKYSQTNSLILILFSILINTSILNKAHQEHHY